MKTNKIDSIPSLIEKITPLNNQYRDLINSGAKGNQVLGIMWEVGNYLSQYIESNNVKPHRLYWQIYGKSEGIRKSYITRDFLSYCLRIKKYFLKKQQIMIIFPNLQSYSVFREAFPLLENPKFCLPENENTKLLKFLNSKKDLREIKQIILALKKDHIGITNTRRQKLNEMIPYTNSFVKFYNSLYSTIQNNKTKIDISKIRQLVSARYLNDLSQLISALTQEDLFIPEIKSFDGLPSYWIDFITKVKSLFSENIEVRNRFRRLVTPKKILHLSDMVLALTSDKNLSEFKKRNNK